MGFTVPSWCWREWTEKSSAPSISYHHKRLDFNSQDMALRVFSKQVQLVKTRENIKYQNIIQRDLKKCGWNRAFKQTLKRKSEMTF